MQDLYAYLTQRLDGARRIAVLGAGSVLRGDDAAGVIVSERLREAFHADPHPHALVCVGETAPENYSGKICNFQPTHVILVDAADVGAPAGEVIEIDPQKVGGPTFCSHMLPLRVMTNYIIDGTGADVMLLGIQYESLEFDSPMTQNVEAAARNLTAALTRFIRENL